VAAALLSDHPEETSLRIGSLELHRLGQLLPAQIASGQFHCSRHIYPVGYLATRIYWSCRYTAVRCRYLCRIDEREGAPEFSVTVSETGHPDESFTSNTCDGVWRPLLTRIHKLRSSAGLINMFPDHITGEDLYGLTEPNILRAVESLPGLDVLKDYAFRPHALQTVSSARGHPSQSAASHPHHHTHLAHHHQPDSLAQSAAPYSKQYSHSKSSQYKRLRTEWQQNVYLGRSRIQGLGLFATRDLEKHSMVIEYIGEVIRNEIANKREKLYESQNRGIYMFRLDDDWIVDATICGGPARYINHSCQPNCSAEVVDVDRGRKIIILANRRVEKGEELTYDYKFDFEDSGSKIPCLCGAPHCRKWMN
uniref:Histone-lysine N-methyltransferase n=1 Tax=Macrostomum lignano TaxID=282301 RepID=A0A1I8H1V6_9PLAT